MLEKIRVTPLAAESLGTRSMCTYVETKDAKILLDAGVSLCAKRFGLFPHPQEYQAVSEARGVIADHADRAEIVTISHYHNDHHTPSFEDWLCNWTTKNETAKRIYQNKTVLVKNPRENINYSQRERAWLFRRTAGKYAKRILNADSQTFTYGETKIVFQKAVPHGAEGSHLGWVLMCTVEIEDEKFTYAPDIQGPMISDTARAILDQNPQLVMLGGPPLYLQITRTGESEICAGLENLRRLTHKLPHIILEHHILRDADWERKTKLVLDTARINKHIVQTAAGFLGKKDTLLESMRKQLYLEDPVSREFGSWIRMSEEDKRLNKPPFALQAE